MRNIIVTSSCLLASAVMRQIKMLALTCLLSMTAAIGAFAQWTDVTSAFVVNPAFNAGNADGWYWWNERVQNHGFQNATYTNGAVSISRFLEMWIPDGTGVLGNGQMCQYSHLPKGKYRLQVDAIATWQGWKAVSQVSGVSLFANVWMPDDNTLLSTQPMSTGNGLPEHYMIEFEVPDGSSNVEFGVLIENTNANWVAVDNFKLEISDNDYVPITAINVTPENITLSPGDERQIQVEFVPSNGTVQSCVYSSMNTTVAQVSDNGLVTAIAPGKAEISVASIDGKAKNVCVVTVEDVPFADGSIVINEIQAANVDYVFDPSFNYGSWIELYNPTDKPCGLEGIYVTDDPANLKKHRLPRLIGTVPAHGYKNIWFDHYGVWNKGEMKQVSFKLNYDGGTIILSDGEKVLAQQNYPQAIGRTSYARTTDGGGTWGVSANPSPESSNNGMRFAKEQLPAPIVDIESKVFTDKFSFKVTIPDGATLRYTTDGSAPTENSNVSKDGQFNVGDGQTAFRFRLFKDGSLPSEVVTRSFIKGDNSFPVISLVTDRYKHLDAKETGIFTKGPNGRPGNGQDENCNWNMDWDRPVNFDFITEDNKCVVSQEVDMAVCGGWSRAWEPHSFKLKAAKYYQGQNSIDYQFFAGKPFLKHKTLQIRNGGNSGLLKDASLQEILRRSGLNIETQSWLPVKVYINGNYHGQLNMREPNNKHYGYANYGIDTDLMDQFEMSPDSGYIQMVGTKEAWNRLIQLSYNAANSSSYEEIGRLLDIDQYINYMAAEFYLENWDWPQNNVKGFRDRNDGRFHFVVFDLDGSFNGANFYTFRDKKNYTFDRLRGNDLLGRWSWGSQMSGEIEFVTLFENMLKNETFRRRFVDAICVIGGSTFHPDFVKPIVNEMASRMDVWRENPQGSLTAERQNDIAGRLKNGAYNFGVNSVSTIKATLESNAEGAGIYVNDMPVPTGRFSGTLYHPVTIKAIAPAGYGFRGWKKGRGSLDNYDTRAIFSKGTVWSYYDGTKDLKNEDWKSASYASSWPQGNAPIGYDKDSNPKGLNTWFSHKVLPTYYVSKTFTLDSKADTDRFTLDFRVDDGMVIYINGKEGARHNLPSGEINYNTYSTTWADNQCDFGTIELPNGLFRIGENTIAVEVHNNDNVSSDIHWDAALNHLTVKGQDNTQYVSNDVEYTLPNDGEVNLIADYAPIAEKDFTEENGVYPVRINEVSAGNTMYVNDYFKRDDWVELYNTTDLPIDITGMYLSDNESNPKKFQIPDDDQLQTVIEPHGHLVIWASKRNIKCDQIHANFKLGNEDGQMVILTSKDETWGDKFVYNAHLGDETVGRYPDGANSIYRMQRPTIGKTNELTSYAEYIYTSTYTRPSDEDARVEDMTDEDIAIESIAYYGLNGICYGNSRGNLTKGIYIMRYTLGNGQTRFKKITIK